MVLLPEHLLRCHPLVGKSYFATDCDDEIEACKQSMYVKNHAQDARTTPVGMGMEGKGQSSNTVVEASEPSRNQNDVEDQYIDRRRAFVINDSPDSGPGIFHAVKKKRGGKVVRVMAVRKDDTEKYEKILRFLFVLLDPIIKAINSRIAVPRPNVYNDCLFCKNISHERREVCESLIHNNNTGINMPSMTLKRLWTISFAGMIHPMLRVSLTKH